RLGPPGHAGRGDACVKLVDRLAVEVAVHARNAVLGIMSPGHRLRARERTPFRLSFFLSHFTPPFKASTLSYALAIARAARLIVAYSRTRTLATEPYST